MFVFNVWQSYDSFKNAGPLLFTKKYYKSVL